MAYKMRRNKSEISQDQAIKILEEGLHGVLCTAFDNVPYGVPLSYVLNDDKIYVHCALEGRKIDYLKANDLVSMVVVIEDKPTFIEDELDFTTKYASAMVEGKAVIINDRTEKIEALRLLCNKYLPDYMEFFDEALAPLDRTCVIKISISNITGKSNI
ncbi:MAG: pyridoxamine 5'-phosphate oxidase family protein [Bacilli bacterium]|nr:pyridoxamine 5'-phosphate oxidase family protein [Bacilli bacterium]